MTKRKRFVLTSFVLGVLLVAANLVDIEKRYWTIGGLTLLSGIMTAWSLREGWTGLARFTTVILPMTFALGAGMFTFLLPEVIPGLWVWNWGIEIGFWVGWSLRGIFWILFVLAFYSLLLTENIFSVSAIRTIALARAASAVGFLLTLVAGFFIYDAIWSFRLPFYWNGLLVWGTSFPLILQGLWSVTLEEKLSREVWLSSVILGLVMGEVALVLSFWPVSVVVGSLVITTMLYVLLGLYQQHVMRRLFKQTLWEYLSVGMVVFVVVLLTTRWGV